jgi:hypothetical protein
MATASVGLARGLRAGDLLLGCVAAQGSAAHAYLKSDALLSGADAARNLADAVHFMGALHGRYPGVVDHASNRCIDAEARTWFGEATYAFAAERAYLARLAVAAGPLPSTPGSADSEGAVLGQRHAMEMLSQSERNGCALGAAMAVVIDWRAIRAVLDAAAQRFGVESPAWAFDDATAIRDLADAFAATPGIQRAMLFGAEQVVVQHFGLWDLLEARAEARAAG